MKLKARGVASLAVTLFWLVTQSFLLNVEVKRLRDELKERLQGRLALALLTVISHQREERAAGNHAEVSASFCPRRGMTHPRHKQLPSLPLQQPEWET